MERKVGKKYVCRKQRMKGMKEWRKEEMQRDKKMEEKGNECRNNR
jgi:hypothetical protein